LVIYNIVSVMHSHTNIKQLQSRENRGCPLQTNSFPYNCEEKRRKTVWKVFCLSNS